MLNTISKDEVIKKLEYFNDDNFKFDEPSHTYTYLKDEYISSTTYIKRFIKEFDSDKYSKKIAEREGKTQEEVLAGWDEIRDYACDLGTEVHEYIEEYYNNDCKDIDYNFNFEESPERVEKFHKIFESRLHKLEPIGSEIRVFHKKYKLAGTIDQLYYYKNSVILGDWKTNKKVRTDKDFAFEYLLYPFSRYKDNEINKYSLQISLYRIMLEDMGIPTHHAFICHIPAKGESKIYELKDFRKELREYLDNDSKPNEPADKPKVSNIW